MFNSKSQRQKASARLLSDAQALSLAEPMLLAKLVVAEESPQWQAFHAVLNRQIEQSRDEAIEPALGNEVRQYRAGRAAALVDLQFILCQLVARAKELPPEKVEG